MYLRRDVQTGASQVVHQVLHRRRRNAEEIHLRDLIGPVGFLDPLRPAGPAGQPEHDGFAFGGAATSKDVDRARDDLLGDEERHVPTILRRARDIWVMMPRMFMPSSPR